MFSKLIMLLAAPAVVLGAQQVPDTSMKQISLADAIRLAKENNVSAVQAANGVRSAALSIRSSRAELYPSLTASTSQGKGSGQRIGPQGTLIDYNAAWTYTTQLSSNLTLFDGGKSFADVRSARANVAAQEANEVNTNYNLALVVKQDYNLILAAKEQEAAARAQLAAAQQQLDFSIAKVNAGAANVSDSLNNVVAVANAQIQILTAQQNLRSAAAALTRVVGTPYTVTANYADTVDLARVSIDSAALVTMALDGPSVRAAIATSSSADATVRSAKAAWFPRLTGGLTYGGSGASSLYGLNSNPYPYSRNITVGINYPIFNGYTRENSIASAQITADNDLAAVRDAKLAAIQTINTQLGVLHNTEEQIRVQQIAIRAAQEGLRVTQQRYALGAGTQLDVLNSQTVLANAQQGLVQARLNYRNAKAQIEQVIGRDLP